MTNRIKKKEEKNSFQSMSAFITGAFTLVVLCVFPLVYHDFYFDILETKYQFYCGVAIATMVLLVSCGLWFDKLPQAALHLDVKKIIKSLNVVDWAILAFWLSNVISWLLCFDWRWEAFWGTSGRYNGVFLMTIYMVVYFLVTRLFHFRQWYLDAFLAVGILVCLFGITDYFQMDILDFKVRMRENQKADYTSTIGNINTYTVYVGVMLVISTVLFALEKNWKRALWYVVAMVVSAFALIMGASDNAYLTLAALFGFAPLFLFKTKTGLRRYLISLAIFFTVIQCIDWINQIYADQVVGIDSAFTLIAGLSILPVIVVGLWILAAAVSFITLRQKSEDDGLGKGLVIAWCGVIALVVAAALFVFYDANIAGNADRYGSIRSYVVFNDDWGTFRGYVWRRSAEIYRDDLSLLQKLFGYGPDTFKLLMQINYDFRVSGDVAIIYDSAHNEYLHFLVTVGLAGMVSYIVFLVSAVVNMCRRMKGRPEVAAVMLAITAYMVQAVININLPVMMPIIIQLLAMGLSGKQEKENA